MGDMALNGGVLKISQLSFEIFYNVKNSVKFIYKIETNIEMLKL